MIKVKLEVGQIWKHVSQDFHYTISRFDGEQVYARESIYNREVCFIYFYNTDNIADLIEGWELQASAKPQSRECPCGIFRGDCTYHS